MSLYIDITTVEDQVERICIQNCGHPDSGEHPVDDDLRKYSFSARNRVVGTVEHRRSQGFLPLVIAVLTEMQATIEMQQELADGVAAAIQ